MIKLLYICLMGLAFGRPNFRGLIANGFRVPCPEGQEDNCVKSICEGLGHLSCAGGGDRNAFGLDFQESGFVWSKELCEADSDGDGIPNGVELGDPCCSWRKGEDSPDAEVSHPGFANSLLELPQESVQCDDVSGPSSEAVAAQSSISSFASEGDDLYVFEYRINEHPLPPKSNSYFNVRFNFPMDQTYDIIGMEPIIDNAPVLHHYLTYACHSETDIEGIPVELETEAPVMTGCLDNFYGWAVGGGLTVYPPNASFRVGKGTDRISFNLNVHYNNALAQRGLKDSSGVRFFTTTKPRKHEIGSFSTGGLVNVGVIPPGKKSYYSSTICQLSLDTTIAPDGIELFSWMPHAHIIGRSIIVEKLKKIEDLQDSDQVLFKNDEYAQIGYVGQKWDFDYNDQGQLLYPAGVKLYDGDILATTCVYDSTSRNQSTYGGQKTEDEMCMVGQMFTPREAVQHPLEINSECAFGRRYNGEFPPQTKSILQVPFHEDFDYEQAFQDGLLTCPQAKSMKLEDMSDVCEGLEFKMEVDSTFLWGSPEYQCSIECATFLYQLFGCDQVSDIQFLAFLLEGSGGGAVMGNMTGAQQQLAGLGGNLPAQTGLPEVGGGSQQMQQVQEYILKPLREDPTFIIPIQCTNKMEDYVEQQKIINGLKEEEGPGCRQDALPKDLEKKFSDTCGYVVGAETCTHDCATFVSTIYKCQSEGVAGLEDIAQMVQEQVGAECAQVISAFQS